MKRAVAVGLAGLMLSACGASATNPPAGASQPGGASQAAGQSQPAAQTQAPAGGGGGSTLVDAAAKVTDVCTLVATDLAAKVVPSAPPPQSQKFPPRQCTFFDGKVQLQVTLASADTDVGGGVPPLGTVPVPGLGAGATVVHPGPDETYLTVRLSPDQGGLYIDISDPSGADRTDDAIAVAQGVLAAIH
jgi:hypothetical protein